jgi:hypothetical protein
LRVVNARLGDGHLAVDLPGSLVQQIARFGRDQAARMAVEEGDAEIVLQCRDLPADGRLRQAEHFGRTGQGPGLCSGMEGFQLVPVHALRLPGIGISRGHSICMGTNRECTIAAEPSRGRFRRVECQSRR